MVDPDNKHLFTVIIQFIISFTTATAERQAKEQMK